MDKVLNQVIAGKWDREKYKKQMAAQVKFERLFSKAGALAQRKKFDDALKVLDEIKKLDAESPMMQFVPLMRSQIILEKGGKGAEKAFDSLMKFAKGNPDRVNQFTWGIVEKELAKKGSYSKAVLEKAEKATKEAAEQSKDGEMKGAILDTYAHLLYLNGKLDDAIKTQKEALEFSNQEGMEEFLEKLEKEAKDKK